MGLEFHLSWVYDSSMAMTLPLKEMTLREKLAAMESLWEDLTRTPESFESPSRLLNKGFFFC